MSDVMIDIETFGIRPGAPILSIGAVVFGPGGIGEEFYEEISLEDSMLHGMEPDASTIRWWFKQKIVPPIFSGKSLHSVLSNFVNFYNTNSCITTWAKSPQFDIVLLEYAMKIAAITPPWKYNNLRDVRTALDLLHPVAADDIKMYVDGDAHNALYDAKYQAWNLTLAGIFNAR